jgi:cyclase
MRRGIVLGLVLAAGAMGALKAQQQQGPKVVDVDKVKDNLYVLKGGGGNTAVFITADGVTVVDAKNPGWGQPILDKIKTLTDKPVTRLINTHTHGDHVSGNVEFPATIDFVAQENTKANMAKMPAFAGDKAQFLPKRTFKDKMTVGSGKNEIDLYYFGPGHTNGDAWVVYKSLRVLQTGDMFAWRDAPTIDRNNGGSGIEYPKTLKKVHAGIKNVDTLINGHSNTTTTWADLQTFQEFNQDWTAWAQSGLKAGKTPQQLADEGWTVPAKYTGAGYPQTVANPKTPPANPPLFGGLTGRIQTLADELKK